MYTIKNYRNYLPSIGLIITYILMKIWDNGDYLSIVYDKAQVYILLINPLVFAFASIFLNTFQHRCHKKYTEGTYALLIQFALYFCAMPFCDALGIRLLFAYFAYVIIMGFVIMAVFYLVEKMKKSNNKKRIFISIFVVIAVVAIMFLLLKGKTKQEKITEYVMDNEQEISNAIDEITGFLQNTPLEFSEEIVVIGNAEINKYVNDVEGLYIEIKGLDGWRKIEIKNEAIARILDGKPVESIGIDNGIIIFDCGGQGISSSSQEYSFYYSPNDEPFAVFDRNVSGETSEMVKKENGFEYIDENSNVYYTEKIIDNFYFCKAVF